MGPCSCCGDGGPRLAPMSLPAPGILSGPSLIYQPPCHPGNLSPLGSWGSLGGTVRRSCRPQLSWLRRVMTLHLTLTGAGLFSRTFCTFCVSPSCLKRRGPEQSAGFSLFPKPRTHFLKSPFGHDFSRGPRARLTAVTAPSGHRPPWSSGAPSSLLLCVLLVTFLCTRRGAQVLLLAPGTLVGRFLAFDPSPLPSTSAHTGEMGCSRGDGESLGRESPGQSSLDFLLGPQTPRIPSLRTESAREEQCLQTDGFWEDWSPGWASRCSSATCCSRGLGRNPGSPGLWTPPPPLWNPRPPDPGSGAPPGTRSWVSRGSRAPGSGLHQPVSNFLCLYVRH